MKNEVILFKQDGLSLEVTVSPEQDTVWLTQKQMGELFEVSSDNIGLHIKNILRDGELDSSTTEKTSVVQKEGSRNVRRNVNIYNLDMILSVGYRVNSKKGIVFRKWANNILRDYMIKGYAVNDKRLQALNKTIEIQANIIASTLELDNSEVYRVVNEYTKALDLLDDYDHQSLVKPSGNNTLYILSYDECRKLIDSMKFESNVFGVEKEKGKLEGILAAVYQNVFGKEVYPSIEEKAANLLYFLVKDHPFADGCKRIAATIFLEFLNKNNALYKNNKQVISNSALVSITLMVAESKPTEKEIMVALIMNFLKDSI